MFTVPSHAVPPRIATEFRLVRRGGDGRMPPEDPHLISCGARLKRSEWDRTLEGGMPVGPPLTLGTRIGARDPSRTIVVEPRASAYREGAQWGLEAVSEDRTGDRAAGSEELVARFSGMLLGVRQWLVPDSLDELRPLRTIKAGTPSWETDGSATEARCFSDEPEAHECPGKGCECGLRAYHPWLVPPWYLWSGDKAANKDRFVTGVVEAWGRIELYPEGFRAQFARPVALVLPPTLRADADARRALRGLCDHADAEFIDPDRPGSLVNAPPEGATDHPDQQLTRTALQGWFARAQASDTRKVLEELLPPEA